MVHKSLSIPDRLECAFAGICLLDLFKMMADRENRKRGLQTGSCWMALQTHRNLQNCALGFLAAVMGKDPIGNPWKWGHGRWTELPGEEWFGRLRMRSHSGQLTCQQFWSASAKEMVRVGKKGMGSCDQSIVGPPTEAEWYSASVRGFKSAIKLAAWCGKIVESSLERAYVENAATLTSGSHLDEQMHEW